MFENDPFDKKIGRRAPCGCSCNPDSPGRRIALKTIACVALASAGVSVAYAFDPSTKTLRDSSRLNRIVLVKLDSSAMDDATRPLAADGVLAYSAFCTHQGCDVSSWLPKKQAFFCFCHFSKFAPLQGGVVLCTQIRICRHRMRATGYCQRAAAALSARDRRAARGT